MKYDLIELQKQLYCALRLPVTIYKNGTKIDSLPETITSVEQIFNPNCPLIALEKVSPQPFAAQFISSKFEEQFIYFAVNSSESLLVGPFLIIEMTHGRIAQMINRYKLPISRKNQLVEHYHALTLLNQQQTFYIGKLMENTLPSINLTNKETAPKPIEKPVPETYFENTCENRSRLFLHSPFFLEQNVCRCITEGKEQQAIEKLKQINNLNRAILADEPIRSLKNSLIASCTLFTRAAINGGISPDDAFTLSDSYIQEIERTDSILVLNTLEEKMVRGFSSFIKTIHLFQYSKTILFVIQYINDHITEKLTVPKLAELVYVHPNYLSYLFKKETGKSISDYIKSRRIEEAKYFIRYSTSSFADIAEFYRFSSQSHFIKAFKDCTGMTPGQYKKSKP